MRRGLFPCFQLCPDWHLETKGYWEQVVSRCFQVSSGKAKTMIDLRAIFGDGPTVAVVAPRPATAPRPEVAPPSIVDWVRRPDSCGRLGWELPGLPECDRWWARCDFADLPEVPEGFSMGALVKTTPQDAPGCVPGGIADTLDLDGNRPLQGQLRGCVGT
jgi:hypothetical protein